MQIIESKFSLEKSFRLMSHIESTAVSPLAHGLVVPFPRWGRAGVGLA